MNTYFSLTLLGFLLSFVVDIAQRNKKSKRTPAKFSPVFFVKDNAWRFFFSACISALLISIYHIGSFDMADYEDFFAVAVGFAPDTVIAWLKRRFGFLKDLRLMIFSYFASS